MKRIILALLFACGSLVVEAQNTTPLPEYNEVVMTLTGDNKLAPLDKSDVITESKVNGMRRTLVYMKVMGDSASTHLMSGSISRFVVTVQPGIDPDNIVELFKFDEITKKSRKILMASVSGGWGKTKDIQLPKQQLSFKKLEPGSYIISPAGQLAPGEYVFLVNRPNISELGTGGKSIKGYCFSIK